MKKKPRRYCIICESIIYRAKSKGQSRQRRSAKNVTCSRPCAKTYIKIATHIRNQYKLRAEKFRREIRRLENEKKKINR